MGSAWSRKQTTIDASFKAAPLNVKQGWDIQHVKILHDKFRDDGHEFGMDRATLRDLINSALPLARGSTENFWLTFVEHEQEMLYPLELFAALALECHGLSREKAAFMFDMFDFEGRGEVSYDELAICISTVVGALSKVCGACGLLDEKGVDNLADDAYVVAASDTSVPMSRSDFLKWVEKGLKIDLSAADVSLEDLGKALGVWSAEEHERLQALRREREQRERKQESDANGLQDIYTREDP
eukprot:g4670.t1